MAPAMARAVEHASALIGGRWIDSGDGRLEVRDPYRNDLVGTVPKVSAAQVGEAITCAARHRSRLSGWDRYEILMRSAEEIRSRADEIAGLITSEAGIAIKTSRHEVERAYQALILSAEEAKRLVGESIPADIVPGVRNRLALVLREPVGVVTAITPFNHPLNQVVHKLGPALAANNRVILKPSEKTPLTALLFGRVLLDCGLPPEMLSIVTGNVAEIGEVLVSHPAVRMVSFTGSTGVGEAITRTAGVKRLCLELGGNGALIVMDDAALDRAVAAAVHGAFSNSGQRCTSVKRILVHQVVAERFVERFVAAVRTLVCGDPRDPETDVGTMIDEAAAARVERLIADAVSDGASLLLGGERRGALLAPAVLDRVRRDSEIVVRETFAPVAPIIRIASRQEAVEIANSTEYGLQAGVFTRGLDSAIYFARHLQVGGVVINEAPGFRIEYLPFGGVKMSGVGREGIRCAVRSMTEEKTVLIETMDDYE